MRFLEYIFSMDLKNEIYETAIEELAKYITWQALLFYTNCDIIMLAKTNTNERLVVMKTADQYKKLTVSEFTKAAEIYETDHAGIYEMCKDDYPCRTNL